MEIFHPVMLYVDKSLPREVSEFRMQITQSTDKTGQVTEVPIGGKIKMVVKATNIGLTGLVKWAADPNEVQSGTITFQNTITGVILKTISFVDAYCIDYIEEWKDSTGYTTLAHTETFTISSRIIQIDFQPVFTNFWDTAFCDGEKELLAAADKGEGVGAAASIGLASGMGNVLNSGINTTAAILL